MQNKKDELLQKALTDLGSKYPDGCISYFNKENPEVMRHINEAEESVNKTYKSNCSAEDFRKVLAYWYKLHIRAYMLYRTDHKTA